LTRARLSATDNAWQAAGRRVRRDVQAFRGMYHVELRQFPHSAWRFNLAEAQVRAVAEPWVREEVISFGERRWSALKATLTILEGPELALQELSMGRGWRAAQRQSEDVTERVLDECRRARAEIAPAPPAGAPSAASPASDPLAFGVQIAALLGSDPLALLTAWRVCASQSSQLKPSESLALAEDALARDAGD